MEYSRHWTKTAGQRSGPFKPRPGKKAIPSLAHLCIFRAWLLPVSRALNLQPEGE